jgi:uncharacterized membrane protein YphA (DoxX/SURF4 family)
MATVVLLVALRVGLGFHFLYEGVWKIKHRHEFTAEPFLSQAKGPLASLFYAMVPDLEGRQRLSIGSLAIKDAEGKVREVPAVDCGWLLERWDRLAEEFLRYYRPSRKASEDRQADFAKLEERIKEVRERFRADLEQYVSDPNTVQAVKGFLEAWERFYADAERSQSAAFQKKRRWDKMMELRGEAAAWINELERREEAFKQSLVAQLDEVQREQGTPTWSSWNPFRWSRMQLINFTVTWTLTAVGLGLVLGLFTRLAALAGGCFMLFVVLTQPAWPTIYPPDPPVTGHALLVNKDFIEMLALFLVATTAVGRWGGLDYFLHHLVFEPILSKRFGKSLEKQEKA